MYFRCSCSKWYCRAADQHSAITPALGNTLGSSISFIQVVIQPSAALQVQILVEFTPITINICVFQEKQQESVQLQQSPAVSNAQFEEVHRQLQQAQQQAQLYHQETEQLKKVQQQLQLAVEDKNQQLQTKQNELASADAKVEKMQKVFGNTEEKHHAEYKLMNSKVKVNDMSMSVP